MLLTTFVSWAVLSCAYGETLKLRVETLHRIASENVACLDGCRILGNHVIEVVGSPTRLGKFIAASMIDNAITLTLRIWDVEWGRLKKITTPPSKVQSEILSLQTDLFGMKNRLIKSEQFDAKLFQGQLQKFSFFFVGKRVILTHGFTKKGRKRPRQK